MTERNGFPKKILAAVLVVILVACYYLSGIFTFDNLSIITFKTCLQDVLSNWQRIWWNDITPACMALGLLIWLYMCNYITYNYRNFQNEKLHGDEDWADPHEITERRSSHDPEKNRILSRNVKIATEGDNAPSNNNMMIWGSSGQYKSTSVVMRNILEANDNFIVLDVKGVLLYTCGLKLKNDGYTLRVLDLKNPERSDRYNPFDYVEKEEDIIKLVANIQESLTPPDTSANDPFWQQGVALYLQSLFFYEWYMAAKEERKASFNNVMQLINLETKYDETVPVPEGQRPPTVLQTKMAGLDDDNPAARDYRKLKEGAAETVRSIVICTNALLKLCETKALQRIFSADDLNMREFATGVDGSIENPSGKKLAVFIVTDDNDSSFNFVAGMLYTQALQILCRMADNDFKERGGKLPIPLTMWLDEYYAGARPSDAEKIMGTVRSRNISLVPILQSKSQIEALYRSGKWEIMMDNCATIIFLGAGSGALATHKYISELLGKMTVDTYSDSRTGKNLNSSYGKAGMDLMTPAQVRRMDRKHCIIFLEGERPVYDRKALPWETCGAGPVKIITARILHFFNKKIQIPKKYSAYQEAVLLNSASADGGYVCPLHGIYNSITDSYDTVIYPTKYEETTHLPPEAEIFETDGEFLYKNYTADI